MAKLSPSFRVLIIGAGPAGLLLAQALKKHGIKSTVFEQDAALDARPRDWNFGIYWAQVPLGDCLSEEMSKDVIKNGQVDNRPLSPDDVLPVYNGETGDLLKALPAPNNIRLHRRNFLRILTEGIDVKYCKRLQRVESDGNTATAYFEDGTIESGDLLVGAEGAHSKVREYLVGAKAAELTQSPVTATAVMAKLPKEAAIAFQKLHPRSNLAFHPAGIFSWVGVHDAHADSKPGDWTFMIIQSWIPNPSFPSPALPPNATSEQICADLKSRAHIFAEPYRTIFASLPENVRYYQNQLSYWIPQPWDNRNSTITLVGDAAHPMTFHRGQGLNNAIHDVASLTNQIVAHGLNPGIANYEAEMQPRGRDAVVMSNENSLLTHDWKTLLKSPLFTAGLKQAKPVDDATATVNGKVEG